jgi:hypothetical protein
MGALRVNGRSAARASLGAAMLACALGGAGCKKKVNQAQCEELLDRYATFVVREKMKDAPPDVLKTEQARERDEARSDDDFKNCTAELSMEDYACAMKAESADALEKCLE